MIQIRDNCTSNVDSVIVETVTNRDTFNVRDDEGKALAQNLIEDYSGNAQSTPKKASENFMQFGTLSEIVNGLFGSKDKYLKTVTELENYIYNEQ